MAHYYKYIKVLVTITILYNISCINVDLQKKQRTYFNCIDKDCEKKFVIIRKKYGIYTGEWSDEMRNGEGTLITNRNDKYTGNWKNNKLCGKGSFIMKDGIYTGVWHDDLLRGIFVHKKKKYKFSGFFKEYDFPYPHYFPVKGKITWNDGSTFNGSFTCVKFSGTKDCGVPNGNGRYIDKYGNIYTGEFSSKIDGNIFDAIFGGENFYLNHMHTGILKTKFKNYSYELIINRNDDPVMFRFNNFLQE